MPGTVDRTRVDTDLVRPRPQQATGVFEGADPAADRERDEHVIGSPLRELDNRLTLVGRRGDVEEHELVGAGGVISAGELDRVAGVA